MNILVISQYYYPEQFRINDICTELAKRGNSVDVLTGLPNYPGGKVLKDYSRKKLRNEKIEGVNIHRSFLIGRGNNSFTLLLNYLSFMLSASFKIFNIRKEFDLVFVYQLSPVSMAFPAILFKKFKKIPILLYCCDIWPESVRTILRNDKNIIFRMVEKFSQYIYKNCDLITVSSYSFIEYFEKSHHIEPKKLKYIPQHAEDFYLNFNNPIENDTIDFVFMGNIGRVQDIESIIYAAQLIRTKENFLVHIVGDGSNLINLKNLVKDMGLDDTVKFHGRKNHEEIKYFYDLADVCLLTLKEDNKTGLTLPSKLQSYMAAGKYVVGAINGSAQEIIRESNCGKCVDSGNHIGLANLMTKCIENKHDLRIIGENGREYFKENFTKEIYMSSIIDEMESIVWGERNV